MRGFIILYNYKKILTEEIKQLGFFLNFANPQDVIDQAAKKLPADARVAVFPQGGATYPVFGK